MDGYCPFTNILDRVNGIQEGDIVYVISDIFRLAKTAMENHEEFDLTLFLDTITAKVGMTGTVLVPTFNWDFCKGKTFCYDKTPSMTGALGNAALRKRDFIRTKHPIYSFCVWGADSDLLFQMDPENSFGEGTIFEYLIEESAKAFVIDLPSMKGMTVMHHVEQTVGVPYRFQKTFTAGYIDWNKEEKVKSYSMYVRDYDYDAEEHLEPMNHLLECLNISETTMINDIPFRVVRLKEMAQILEYDYRLNDARNTYCYKGQKPHKILTEKYDWQ